MPHRGEKKKRAAGVPRDALRSPDGLVCYAAFFLRADAFLRRGAARRALRTAFFAPVFLRPAAFFRPPAFFLRPPVFLRAVLFFAVFLRAVVLRAAVFLRVDFLRFDAAFFAAIR